MGTYNSNIYPSTTGLQLGNASQRWKIYATDIDVDGSVIIGGFNPHVPGPIGDVTPSTGNFTDITTSGPWTDPRSCGIVPNDASAAVANLAAFNACQPSVNNPWNLYFGSGDWYFSGALHCRVNGGCSFLGYGLAVNQAGPETNLVFTTDSSGIACLNSENCRGLRIEHIGLQGNSPFDVTNYSTFVLGGTSDGIQTNSQFYINDIYVTGFSRHALNVNTNGTASIYPIDANVGNSDNSILKYHRFTGNRGAGANLEGVDSNKIFLGTGFSDANQLWGYRDESYFGNIYQGMNTFLNHTDYSGNDPSKVTTCTVTSSSLTNNVATIILTGPCALRMGSWVVGRSLGISVLNNKYWRVTSVKNDNLQLTISTAPPFGGGFPDDAGGAGGHLDWYQGTEVWLDYQYEPQAITGIARTSGVCTVTLAAPINYFSSNRPSILSIKGSTASFNGEVIYSSGSGTTLNVLCPAFANQTVGAGGTIGIAASGGGYAVLSNAADANFYDAYAEADQLPNMIVSETTGIWGHSMSNGFWPTGSGIMRANTLPMNASFGDGSLDTNVEVFLKAGVGKGTLSPHGARNAMLTWMRGADITNRAWGFQNSGSSNEFGLADWVSGSQVYRFYFYPPGGGTGGFNYFIAEGVAAKNNFRADAGASFQTQAGTEYAKIFPSGLLGTGTASNADLAGQCVLGTSCVITFTGTYATAPICVGTDVTAANPVKVVVSTTQATFTGTGTDTINYICMGTT